MSQTLVSVIVATVKRPQEARLLVEVLRHQTRPPDRIIVSVSSAEDFPFVDLGVERVVGPVGSCVQRNSALDHLGASDGLIVFMDDDYLPSRFALERIEVFFDRTPDAIGANGRLIADGIKNAGIDADEALRLVAEQDEKDTPDFRVTATLGGLYGCNMVVRGSSIGAIRFDERLPLYGWQEDIDFSARVKGSGHLVQTNAWSGVHRGVKRGRTSGLRFGYSQVANPIYLVRKGTMPADRAYGLLARNLIANHMRALWPEPWVDRFGRAKGNWRALRDLMRGTLRPEAILDL